MPYQMLHSEGLAQLGDDRWRLLNWSTNASPFPILVRCLRNPAPPLGNSTYGFVGIYQVADGRLLMFDNQTLFSGLDNGTVWGTWIPANANLLINAGNPPARWPWGVIVAPHRWMQPFTITLERFFP